VAARGHKIAEAGGCLQSVVARQAWKAGFYVGVVETLERSARTTVQCHRRAGIASPTEVSRESGHSTVVSLERTDER